MAAAAAPDTGNTAAAADTGAAGSQNVGKGNGQQFITGQCLTDADCASACCAGLNGKGTCSAVAVANANGKTGCGFGGAAAGAGSGTGAEAAAPSAPAQAAPAAGGNTGAAGSQNVGKGNGQQFITGQCLSDADCASGCCAGPKGACSARAVAEEQGKTGCGFTAAARF